MEGLVLQLQRDAMTSDVAITDLLRKAMVVAKKLGVTEFQKWITLELSGYAKTEDLPEYRNLQGQVSVFNPYRGVEPLHFADADTAKQLSTRIVSQPISELEHLAQISPEGRLKLTYAPETQVELMKLMTVPLTPFLVIGKAQVLGIIDAVRNCVLDWAMKLEQEGITGEGMTFTDEEKEKARTTAEVHIQYFQGILGDVSHSTVTQELQMSVTPGDFESLRCFLVSKGIAGDDIADLQQAIKADPQPESPDGLGEGVTAWLGRMASKAATGAWQLGASVSGSLLAQAIMLYYST